VEHVEGVAAWLTGASEDRLRPFSGGRPLAGQPVGHGRERLTMEQLLDRRPPP
jgi:hypothetical protein